MQICLYRVELSTVSKAVIHRFYFSLQNIVVCVDTGSFALDHHTNSGVFCDTFKIFVGNRA